MLELNPAPALDDGRRAQADAALGALIDSGDLDRIVQLARLIGSAQDALTDDIVGRVASVATDGIDLVDRVNRSGAVRALPAIAAMADNGDLDRLAQFARLVSSAEDALSDDIVSRVASVAAEGMDLVDRINRSGAAKALPAIASLVENGDLDRIVQLARLVAGALDALTDDMIVRLATVASHALSLVERVTRTGLAEQLVELADTLERSGLAPDMLKAIDEAVREVQAAPPPKGGLSGLVGVYTLMKNPDTQRAMHFGVAALRVFCRARTQTGVGRA
jgi:uncharacterized protein YjgD (DUF1641 family)